MTDKQATSRNKPRVLIVTMSCGEPQFEQCKASVLNQQGVDCVHTFIIDKPNFHAHKELYEIISEQRHNFDYFIKLDADMTLSDVNSVRQLISYFEKDVDHVTIPVFDYFTNGDIPALHVFSNRVRFDQSKMSKLHPDYVGIAFPGKSINYRESNRLVLHCFEPTVEQAFLFGAHRALKIMQRNQEPDFLTSFHHYKTLSRISARLKDLPHNHVLQNVLLGASYIFYNKDLTTMGNKNDFYVSAQNHRDRWLLHKSLKNPNLIELINLVGIKTLYTAIPKMVIKVSMITLSKFRKLGKRFADKESLS